MAGESFVAILAGIVFAAALHLDGDDVDCASIVGAAGLLVEADSVDFWARRKFCVHS
jgi:hypothetical protein